MKQTRRMKEEFFDKHQEESIEEIAEEELEKHRVTVKPAIIVEIGIDCPPLVFRPDFYLPDVIKDTPLEGIDPAKTEYRLFGAWLWKKMVHDHEWTEEVFSTIWNRLNTLYKNGAIRGARLNPKPK